MGLEVELDGGDLGPLVRALWWQYMGFRGGGLVTWGELIWGLKNGSSEGSREKLVRGNEEELRVSAT